jgi:hypothetical protein
MDQSTHEIQREREQTRAALTEKIELLEERVRDTKRAVKQKFDYRYQTEQQPWKMVGVSVAIGYLLGKTLKPAPRAMPARPTQAAQVAQKSTLKGAMVGAVVPMLMEFVKGASLASVRALFSRGSSSDRGTRGQARVLTPFRDEPPHTHPTAAPNKPLIER